MKRILFLILLGLVMHEAGAQPTTLSLDQCYDLAKKNYPLVKQYELINKSKDYSIDNANKGYLPQVNIFGQATYQSDVVELPIKIPNINLPKAAKDQYRLYAEVSQPVYEGGVIKQQKIITEADAVVEQQKVEVELYKLKDRINQLFFGILMIDEQLKQIELLKKDILSGISKIKSGIDNGTALKSNLAVLNAELIKAGQRTTELNYTRKAFTDMLTLFTGINLDDHVLLIKPSTVATSTDIKRPELLLYSYQTKAFDARNELLNAKNRPKISCFIQGGYGRPAFNILSNKFNAYYIGGVRLNFPLTGFYTIKNDRKLLALSSQSINVQKETFLFNTSFNVKQQKSEIDKLQEIVKDDEEIISLRTEIKNTASVQLENGIINTSDFIREVNAEDNARQSMILHEIQLLMAQYNLQTTTGN